MLPNVVLFQGSDSTNTQGLWETNGTASGTFLITNGTARYGFTPDPQISLDLTVFKNQVLFIGRDATSAQTDYSLWSTDGTAAGTTEFTNVSGANPKGLFTSAAVTWNSFPDLTVFNNEVLFNGLNNATAAGVHGLWETNGTAAGTAEITGINGVASTGLNPSDITVFNGIALFNGASSANAAGPAGHLGLWTTNGTASGTTELGASTGIAGAATTGLDPTDMTVFGSEVLFNGVDADGKAGLWETNGTASGTHELLAGAGGVSDPSGLNPTDMTVFGSEVLFNGLNSSGDMGLWVTDGTAGGTHEITGIANVAASGLAPSDLTVFNGEVLFRGFDIHNRAELWETNGTATGTQVLPIAGTPSTGPNPSGLEVYNGQVLFSALALHGSGATGTLFQGLWSTDGTASGAHEVAPISGARSLGLFPVDLTALTPGLTDGILWQNANGQAALWSMSGSTVVGGGPVSPNPGPGWKTIGSGDFNADGSADILWQNANGQAAIWEMNGTTLIGGGSVTPNPGAGWTAIGTGDFNHDGHSDILWQNSDGQAAVWEMNGNTVIGGGAVTPNPGPGWKAVGTGDFNADGSADILWQNADGQAAIWEMNGNTLIGGGTVTPNPGPGWKAIGSGDFNDDGHSDIVWQNANGPSRDLGDEREHLDRRRNRQLQSRAELACDRNRRRRVLGHPLSKHERPNRHLGHERDDHRRRRTRQPQSRIQLASRRPDLKVDKVRRSGRQSGRPSA